jgi:hypothetical protein
MRKRKNIEIFSLYFLDGMSCAFGAVIMLLLITKAAEPRIIEAARTDRQGLIAALQKELAEIRGESDVLVRDRLTVEPQLARNRELLAQLQGELTKTRGEFAAGKEKAVDSDAEGEMQAARQKLTDEMRRLLANYRPPAVGATIGGIPVDSEYIIFVIDSSGSMQSQWPLVVRKVTEALEVYPRVKGIQIMNGDGRYLLESYIDKWIPDSQETRRLLLNQLRNWTANDTSNLVEGIQKAVQQFYDPKKRISIYVFGDDVMGNKSVESVVRYVEGINSADQPGNRHIRIHGVGFRTGMSAHPQKFALLMRTLSSRNGGTFVALTDTSSAGPRVIIQGFPGHLNDGA